MYWNELRGPLCYFTFALDKVHVILRLLHLVDVEGEEAGPESVLVRRQLVAEEELPGVEPVAAERFAAVFALDWGATPFPFPRLFPDFLWVCIGPLATDRYLIFCLLQL